MHPYFFLVSQLFFFYITFGIEYVEKIKMISMRHKDYCLCFFLKLATTSSIDVRIIAHYSLCLLRFLTYDIQKGFRIIALALSMLEVRYCVPFKFFAHSEKKSINQN